MQHVYLENVVNQVLSGHPNNLQHISLLAQHKLGAITAQQQVGGINRQVAIATPARSAPLLL